MKTRTLKVKREYAGQYSVYDKVTGEFLGTVTNATITNKPYWIAVADCGYEGLTSGLTKKEVLTVFEIIA